MNSPGKSPGLTVGVITHDRFTLFSNLFVHLKIALNHFHADGLESSQCSLLVVNNSGEQSRAAVQQIVDESTIGEICAVAIIDSPKNNIAIGRNLILENTLTRWLVFIDDDEYPLAAFPQQLAFMLKAFLIAPVSLVVGALALPVSSRISAYWLKRGFTNLGKLIRPSKRLYG